MFARLALVVSLANLTLDLLGDQIDRGVEILFGILSEKVGPGHRQPYGTLELAPGGLGLVVFQRDTCVNREPVIVIQLFDAVDDVVLDGPGEPEIVRGKNQLH